MLKQCVFSLLLKAAGETAINNSNCSYHLLFCHLSYVAVGLKMYIFVPLQDPSNGYIQTGHLLV